jgi:hypothetical protein
MDQVALFRSIVQDKPVFPLDKSGDVQNLMELLLVKDPVFRLGSLAFGDRQILEHAWFSSVNSKLYSRRALKAPWIPQLNDILDTRNFEDWSDLQDATNQKYDSLRQSKAALFDGY